MFKIGSRFNVLVLFFPISMAFLTILAYFPGAMSPDTLNQFSQAITGSYDDLHPPIMAAFWRTLLFLWNNPGVLFAAHVLSYWFFWWGLAVILFENWKKQILVLSTAVLPPLWSQTIVVWKDTELSLTLLGAYLFIMTADLTLSKNTPLNNYLRIIFLSLCLLLFIYSAAVRENSLPALIPLAAYFMKVAFKKISTPLALVAACCFCGFSMAASHLIDYDFLKAKKWHGYQVCAIFDIAGVYSRARQPDLIPGYWQKLNPNLTPEMISRNYTPTGVVPLIFYGEQPLNLTSNPGELRELNQKWLGAIFHFPVEFLYHRWEVFKVLMGIGLEKIYFPFFLKIDPNSFGIKNQGDLKFQEIIKTYFTLFRDTLLFRGWFYLVGLLGIITFQWRNRENHGPLKLPAVCSAISALFYGLGYFFYAPAGDFRFLYPTVTLFFLSLILTFGGFEGRVRVKGRLTVSEADKVILPKRGAKVRRKPSRQS